MTLYELGVIIDPEVSPEEEAETLERFEQIIGKGGGSIVEKDAWGRRQLAYPIRRKTQGSYHFWKFELPSSELEALEFELRTNDRVMRSLILNLDRELRRKRKRERLERVKAAKKAARAEAAVAEEE